MGLEDDLRADAVERRAVIQGAELERQKYRDLHAEFVALCVKHDFQSHQLIGTRTDMSGSRIVYEGRGWCIDQGERERLSMFVDDQGKFVFEGNDREPPKRLARADKKWLRRNHVMPVSFVRYPPSFEVETTLAYHNLYRVSDQMREWLIQRVNGVDKA